MSAAPSLVVGKFDTNQAESLDTPELLIIQEFLK